MDGAAHQAERTGSPAKRRCCRPLVVRTQALPPRLCGWPRNVARARNTVSGSADRGGEDQLPRHWTVLRAIGWCGEKARLPHEDSGYTFMIAIMHCPKGTILVLKLTLVEEIQALLLCRRPPLLDRSLRRWLPVQSYEGTTKILTSQP